MTSVSIAEIQARLDAASPLPWWPDFDMREHGADQVMHRLPGTNRDVTLCFLPSDDPMEGANTNFIANAPADIRKLLADNAKLENSEKMHAKSWARLMKECIELKATVDKLGPRLDVYQRAWRLATKTLAEHQVGSDGEVWNEVVAAEKEIAAENKRAREAHAKDEARLDNMAEADQEGKSDG